MGRRRKRRRRSTGTGFILVLVLTILGTVSYARTRLDHRRNDLLERQIELDQKIADEKERTLQIEELGAYVQTKKYIAETAREKLGLVDKDDVIFRPEVK